MVLPAVPFRFEHEMRDPIRRALPGVITTDRRIDVQILREPCIGRIIPDLLIGIGTRAKGKVETKAYSGNRLDAHLMSLLESEKGMTAAEIATSLYLSEATVDDILRRLSRAGVVRPGRRETWCLSAQHRCLSREIIAIELKLSRWREALHQAAEYLTFANRAYVILDGNRVRETTALRFAFVSLGVGLLFQYGFLTVAVVEPRRNRPRPSVSRVLATSKLFGESKAVSRRLSWPWPNDLSAVSTSEMP